MRKLLVVLLALVVGVVVVFAGSDNVTVSWKTYWVTFKLTVDEKGIDVSNSAYFKVFMTSSESEEGTPVSFSFSFGFSGFQKVWAVDSMSFNGKVLEIDYNNFGAVVDEWFLDNNNSSVGTDHAVFSLKALPELKFYYVDLVGETDIDTGTPVAKVFFDDLAAVKFSKNVAGMDLTMVGAYYDTDATADTISTYEYVGVLHFNGNGLNGWAAFGNPTVGTAYGVEASYKWSMTATPVTVSVVPGVHYSENLTALRYVDTSWKPWDPEYVYDGKHVWVGLTTKVDFGMGNASVFLKPNYSLDDSKFTMKTDLKAALSVDPLSVNLEYYIKDAIDFSNTYWRLDANANAVVSDVSVGAAFAYNNSNKYAYNACVGYTIEKGLKAKVFYGTLYDKDGDGSMDINPEDPQWYLQLTFSY